MSAQQHNNGTPAPDGGTPAPVVAQEDSRGFSSKEIIKWAGGIFSGVLVIFITIFTAWVATTLSDVEKNQTVMMTQMSGVVEKVKEHDKSINGLSTRVAYLEVGMFGVPSAPIQPQPMPQPSPFPAEDKPGKVITPKRRLFR